MLEGVPIVLSRPDQMARTRFFKQQEIIPTNKYIHIHLNNQRCPAVSGDTHNFNHELSTNSRLFVWCICWCPAVSGDVVFCGSAFCAIHPRLFFWFRRRPATPQIQTTISQLIHAYCICTYVTFSGELLACILCFLDMHVFVG